MIEHQRSRKKFIVDRIAEHGPEAYGNRGFMPHEIEENSLKEQVAIYCLPYSSNC